MPVIDTTKQATSFTIVSEFDAPIERVWQLWADPRKLERWWGPPGFPATFIRHDFAVQGKSVYYMSSEDGTPASADGSDATSYAAWRFVSIEAPRALEIDNGFSDETGEPIGDYAWNRFSVRLEPTASGTRMTVETRFATAEELAQMVGLGMLEGSVQAQSQIDAILAED
ncbi:MAG TPA: SRPBCC domain-containing protein [Microbacteriaceae bacterium]|nr:SRPBCC domain-containing protein [Microbacteriaceae bacterium]